VTGQSVYELFCSLLQMLEAYALLTP